MFLELLRIAKNIDDSGEVPRSAGVVPEQTLSGCGFGTTPRVIRFAITLPS
jgi:hypothetical protein